VERKEYFKNNALAMTGQQSDCDHKIIDSKKELEEHIE